MGIELLLKRCGKEENVLSTENILNFKIKSLQKPKERSIIAATFGTHQLTPREHYSNSLISKLQINYL